MASPQPRIAAIADRPGLTYDAIHLNTFGAGQYAANIARVVMSAANRLRAGSVTALTVAGTNGVPADATAALTGYMIHANMLGKASFTAKYRRAK